MPRLLPIIAPHQWGLLPHTSGAYCPTPVVLIAPPYVAPPGALATLSGAISLSPLLPNTCTSIPGGQSLIAPQLWCLLPRVCCCFFMRCIHPEGIPKLAQHECMRSPRDRENSTKCRSRPQAPQQTQVPKGVGKQRQAPQQAPGAAASTAPKGSGKIGPSTTASPGRRSKHT